MTSPNGNQSRKARSLVDHDRRFELYSQGLPDNQIAQELGLTVSTVWGWRTSRNLPANKARRASVLQREARWLAMYEAQATDAEMAIATNYHARDVLKWRHLNGLPAIRRTQSSLSPEQRAARMLLYSFGYTDLRIGLEQGRSKSAVGNWRKRLNLEANGGPHVAGCRWGRKTDIRDKTADLLRRVKTALPSYLAPADRDDAASDLFLAVMSGEIPINEIEARSKKFGNRVIADYASKWGARSLDEEIGDGDGFTLLDTIADDSASSWLEEMGATVW